MFKQLLNTLRGTPPSASGLNAASNAPASPADPISAYDADGKEIQIERNVWVNQVLPHALQQAWDHPDALYQHILTALNDQLAAAVDAASVRLVAIDPIPARSCTARALVLLQIGRLDEAEQVLRDGIATLGELGVLYTNLAKVQAEREDMAAAEATLLKAIELDPNFEHSLGWWCAIQRERGGAAAYVQALEQASRIAGSWRAQIWLGLDLLRRGDVEAAMGTYRALLAAGSYTSDSLIGLSGDLGRTGNVARIPELLAGAYQLEQHNPQVGLNLLKAYAELKQRQEGEALLARMRTLPSVELTPYLEDYADKFRAMPG